MKKKFFFAAVALVALASCTSDDFVGENNNSPNLEKASDAIVFNSGTKATTRAGEYVGATAAEMLGGMFVVEGTKGSETASAPSTEVVFDNYLVGYDYNSAGKTESNTNNWEYVGKQTGITGRLSSTTWNALHPSAQTSVTSQSIKYWDYSKDQYDFIAWSTGEREAVTTAPEANSKIQVTRINTGTTLATNGFTFNAANATDLLKCYYTDITTVTKASGNYGKPVTLKFKNMAAKVRVALYETVPGYSVKEVKFYTEEADDPTQPDDLNDDDVKTTNATLFTTGSGIALPQSGEVLVYYPRIGSDNSDAIDYNKASVSVDPGSATSTTQAFGVLTSNYTGKDPYGYEEDDDIYLGRNITEATFAGDAADAFYQAVIPNTNGYPLTLRLDYTLVSIDGSEEEIHVYGAKAVVPATYTVWQPNYAYTYIFKISDNSNGWTSIDAENDPAGLFPITFDAVVASFTDANAEQTTVTTVATPSITTYQQGHDHANKDEYSKSQIAGADEDNVKDLYVQVMDNSGASPTLVEDLDDTNSFLYLITKDDDDYVASEAEVMDALLNRTNTYNAANPEGRNSIKLTKNGNIDNTVDEIVNGVDDQPITKIGDTDIAGGMVAKIDIDQLDAGTYAYVYATTVPTEDEKIYNVVSPTTAEASVTSFYEVDPDDIGTTPLGSGAEAEEDKLYFVGNLDAQGNIVSYTFKQTKIEDDVEGLYEADVPGSKASDYTAGHFYFDVYNQNDGAYAVKVIKVVP